MILLPAGNSLAEKRDGERQIPDGKRWDDSPICCYSQTVTGLVISYLLMIPLINIGIVTGKTERPIASWLKRG